MIRLCTAQDFNRIHAIINDGARAYKGIIPADRWSDPYMSTHQLQHEISEGVIFWGYQDNGQLSGVMGIQPVRDVTLIRHAYVLTTNQKQGIGARLLAHLRELATGPVLIGTWADAIWAIRFYEKHGFQIVSAVEKDQLLKTYWSIPDRQVETSVVLADATWRNLNPRGVQHP
ncbi:MAG TPA: GNAT family N-acetyltransferase [Candidatus Acidoferrum sp.]|nr:GNAT family N-acetyltransferase [Candidatus Acidoferrum sp.]